MNHYRTPNRNSIPHPYLSFILALTPETKPLKLPYLTSDINFDAYDHRFDDDYMDRDADDAESAGDTTHRSAVSEASTRM